MIPTPTPRTGLKTEKFITTVEVLNLEKLENSQNAARNWQSLLDGNLCIGENHEDISPKKFLIQNMSLFKDKGFTNIIMEHFSKEHQTSLDQYFDSQEQELPKNLKDYFEKLDKGHMGKNRSSGFNFTKIVESAKEHQIKIVCAEESHHVYKAVFQGPNRMLILNSRVKQLSEKILSENQNCKWIAFVGTAHVNTSYNIPGICEIIPNVQDLIIIDANDFRKTEMILANQKIEHEFKSYEGDLNPKKFSTSMLWVAQSEGDMKYREDLPETFLEKKSSEISSSSTRLSELFKEPSKTDFPKPKRSPESSPERPETKTLKQEESKKTK